MSIRRGHCFCNAVQFEVEGPEKYACYCYCNSCQQAAGAPVVAWSTYKKSTFRVAQGKIRNYNSSPGVTRGHCATCGSTISYKTEKRPNDIDITLNTHADPNGPKLRAHIFTEDKPSWLEIGDDLPVFEKNSK